MPRLPAIPALLLAALTAGCGGVEIQGPAPADRPAPAVPAFLDAGVDLADDPDAWAPGDAVVLRVQLDKPDARTVLYFRIELTDRLSPTGPAIRRTERSADGLRDLRLASPVLATRLTVFDETGARLQESAGETPILFLTRGLGRAQPIVVRRLFAPADEPPPPVEEVDEVQLDYLSFMLVNESTDSNPVMKDLVAAVIRRPSILGFLFDHTIRIASDWRTTERPARWVPPHAPPGFSTRTASIVGYTLRAADTVLLQPVITTIPVRPPLGLCGGLVALDAVKPDDPAVRLQVRLVSATRGAGKKDPAWPAPTVEVVPR